MILKVGTDCSGIEAPIQALKQLKIPFKHIFSSEIDKYAIESIKANYNPEIIFGDITKRKIEDIPDIDLYVCGFPCQPFSSSGKKKGFNDERGNIFFNCLELIEIKQPIYFILENVKGILNHNNKKTWSIIWSKILNLQKYGYYVDYKLLNTRDYGIPQNRERIYIIGSKKQKIIWSPKLVMNNLNSYLDNDNIEKQYSSKFEKIKDKFINIENKPVFIDLNFCRENDTYKNADKWSPCLNTQNGLWNNIYHRYATIKERLRLQGFPDNFKQVVSNTQLNKQIGNSMSVNVLINIITKNIR